jgi:predicted DNA-binding protein (MmcQ/YjbR family)
VCLALPDVTEKLAWGHPTFRVAKKTFVAFEMIKTRPTIAFRLPPARCQTLIADGRAFATPYGRNLWASVWVDESCDPRELRALVQASYRTIAPQRRRRAVPVATPRPRLRARKTAPSVDPLD